MVDKSEKLLDPHVCAFPAQFDRIIARVSFRLTLLIHTKARSPCREDKADQMSDFA
jgi:hypothetical protein